jgi:hypothetical protein
VHASRSFPFVDEAPLLRRGLAGTASGPLFSRRRGPGPPQGGRGRAACQLLLRFPGHELSNLYSGESLVWKSRVKYRSYWLRDSTTSPQSPQASACKEDHLPTSSGPPSRSLLSRAFARVVAADLPLLGSCFSTLRTWDPGCRRKGDLLLLLLSIVCIECKCLKSFRTLPLTVAADCDRDCYPRRCRSHCQRSPSAQLSSTLCDGLASSPCRSTSLS